LPQRCHAIKGIKEYAGFDAKDIAAIEKENALNLFPRIKKFKLENPDNNCLFGIFAVAGY